MEVVWRFSAITFKVILIRKVDSLWMHITKEPCCMWLQTRQFMVSKQVNQKFPTQYGLSPGEIDWKIMYCALMQSKYELSYSFFHVSFKIQFDIENCWKLLKTGREQNTDIKFLSIPLHGICDGIKVESNRCILWVNSWCQTSISKVLMYCALI